MNPQEPVYVPIKIGVFYLSIGPTIVWIFIASGLLLLLVLLATRKLSLVPVRPLQNIFEYAAEFVEKQIVEPAELDSDT